MSDNFDYGLQYSEFHEDSDAHFESRVVFEINRLQPLLPAIPVISSLDIGCGRGFTLAAMQRLGIHDVQGIDVDESQISSACSRGLKACRTHSISEYLDATNKQFELIVMMDVLEHVPKNEQVATVRSIYRVLAPGGRLVVQVPNANSIAASRWLYNDFTHICSYTEQSLRPVMLNGGFTKVKIESAGNSADRPSLRPSRVFTKSQREQARRWLVRLLWRQVLIAELGDTARSLPLELNLLAIADKPF